MVVSCEANCKKTSTHAHHQAYMCDQYSEFLHTLKAFDKQQVDDRIKETLTLEDMDVLVELQHQNEGHAAQYDVFWTKCTEYTSSECSAVHERWHEDISYMATAIFACDMINQVIYAKMSNKYSYSHWSLGKAKFLPKIHRQKFLHIIWEC